ncbi:tetratricopeptide repeat protein [bacterium]|nr:tetratricopeptide repeat protein [bacterium]
MRSLFPYILAGTMVVLFLAPFSDIRGAQESDVVVNRESGDEYRDGLALYKKNDFKGALAHFERAYALDGRNINAQFACGLSLNGLKRYKEAAEAFARVIESDPANEKALRMLPVALDNAGDTGSALTAYDRGIEALPGNFYLRYGKALLYMKLGQQKNALPLLKKADELNPGKIEVLEKILIAYSDLGDIENAYKTAQIILTKDPGHARARVAVADYLRFNKKYREAIEEYTIASKNLETKAYAEHYIDVIRQTLEELDIEKEFEARQKQTR